MTPTGYTEDALVEQPAVTAESFPDAVYTDIPGLVKCCRCGQRTIPFRPKDS